MTIKSKREGLKAAQRYAHLLQRELNYLGPLEGYDDHLIILRDQVPAIREKLKYLRREHDDEYDMTCSREEALGLIAEANNKLLPADNLKSEVREFQSRMTMKVSSGERNGRPGSEDFVED